MRHPALISSMILAAAGGVSGCEKPSEPAEAPFEPVYDGIETRLFDGDLVHFPVPMQGARPPAEVEDYAECAAAQ